MGLYFAISRGAITTRAGNASPSCTRRLHRRPVNQAALVQLAANGDVFTWKRRNSGETTPLRDSIQRRLIPRRRV